MPLLRSITKASAVCWIASVLLLGILFTAFFIHEKMADFKSRLAAANGIYAEYRRDILRGDVETAIRLIANEAATLQAAPEGRPMSASAKKQTVEAKILEKLAAVHVGRGRNGSVFIVSNYGAMLFNPFDELFKGQNALRLEGVGMERLLEDARRPQGAFANFKTPAGTQAAIYAKRIQEPAWIVCATVPDNALAGELSESIQELKAKLMSDMALIILAAILVVAGALWLSYNVSKAVKREIDMLVSYCRGSAAGKDSLKESDFFFDEFKFIASSLISMVRSINSLVGTVKDLALRSESGNQAKSGFIASVRSEMAGPVNGIMDMVRILKDSHLDRAQRECVEAIDVSVQNLSRLASDIRDFSVDEAGRLQLMERPFDLERMLRDLVARMEPLAKESGDKLELRLPEPMPKTLRGDEGKLAQCIQTLIANALKFTKDGLVAVELSREDGLFLFKIRDTGLGISQGKLKGIFEFAGDAATAGKFGGVSLGLAVVKGMVEAMGGKIEAASEKGKGSTFVFKVPLKDA